MMLGTSPSKFAPFIDTPFPNPNLESNLESYARFIFSRIAYVRGTPCAIIKNGKAHPKGDLKTVFLAQHAAGDVTMGVSLAEKETGNVRAICLRLDGPLSIKVIGKTCRLLSTMQQDGIDGLGEICPDGSIRIWALFRESFPLQPAIERIMVLKSWAFIGDKLRVVPMPDELDHFIPLPPYRDQHTGRWSQLLSLKELETILDGNPLPTGRTDWDFFTLPDSEANNNLLAEDFQNLLFLNPQPGNLKTKATATTQFDLSRFPSPGKDPISAPPLIASSSVVQPEAEEKIQQIVQQPQTEFPDNEKKEPSIVPLSDCVPAVIGRLLNPTQMVIPTPSREFNKALNGGLTARRVYLLTGSSGEGKTTFTSWLADHAAREGTPVVYASFQISPESLTISALSRAARVDSALIERRLWLDPTFEEGEDIRKKLVSAGRQYYQVGDYLNVVSPESWLTMNQISRAIEASRSRLNLNQVTPVLVILDSLREITLNDEKSDGSTESLSKVAFELKRIAEKFNAVILTTLDLPGKTTVSDLPVGLTSIVDGCFWLDRGHNKANCDNLENLFEGDGLRLDLKRTCSSIREHYPLEGLASSVYTRLHLIKNPGGKTTHLLVFRYDRAYHDFKAVEWDRVY